MTTKEIAQALDGMEYPVRIPNEVAAQAKSSGIVIVYGYSDDLVEFEGVVSEERGAYEGTKILVDSQGIIDDFETLLDERDKDRLRKYFERDGKGKIIEAVWNEDGYSFTYKTDIPHETFEVVEDGKKYCRGIVFNLSDVK